MTDTPPTTPLGRAARSAVDTSRLSGAIRGLVYFAVAAFLLGAGALIWALLRTHPDPKVVASQTLSEQAPRAQMPLEPKAAPLTLDEAEVRMEGIEARLAEANRLSAKALDDASRAERLLILSASRRLVDRGRPLGYLEAMLQRQFGKVYPGDVGTIISASRQPITLLQLSQDPVLQQADLLSASGQAGWVENIFGDLRGLAVVRRSDQPSEAPSKKLTRAREALSRDQVDEAIREIAAMPGAAKAKPWLDKARRYVAVRAALDRLEAATILNPQPGRPEAPAPAVR